MTLHWPTFVFQAVNFLVLLGLLTRLLFRPLLSHMRERRARIDDALSSIAEQEQALAEQRSALEQERSELERRRAEAAAEGRREGERTKARLMAEGREEADRQRERMLAQVEQEKLRMEDDLLRSVGPLVERTVIRILEELAPDTHLHEAACERLARYVEALDPTAEPVEVESATGAIPEPLRRALARVASSGEARPIRRRPELIAGARVRVGDEVHDGSLQAQVARALEAPA